MNRGVRHSENAQSIRRIFTICGLFLAAVSLQACGKKPADAKSHRFVLSCGPSDQHEGYLNPLDVRQVVRVGFDSRFKAAEKDWILSALDSWNHYSVETRANRVLFEPEEMASATSTSIPGSTEDCAFSVGESGFDIVLVNDDAKWKALGVGVDNPAVTVRCSRPGEFVSKQVVLVNVNITRAGVAFGKFEAIIKHEIGHTLGLDHSCDLSGNSAGWLGCAQAGVQNREDYLQAIMYPYICKDGIDCTNRPLNSNDRERAACILGVSG